MAYLQTKLRLSLAVAGSVLLPTEGGALQSGVTCDADSTVLTYALSDRTTRLPLPGARVTAGWQTGQQRTISATTDSLGRARLCVPVQQRVLIAAAYHQYSAAPVTLTTTGRTSVHTVLIDVPGVYVRGRVLDQQTGAPIGQVAVRLIGTTINALSDREGRFVLGRLPIGEYQLRADHIGYSSNSAALRLLRDDLDALIWLAPEAIPLQPIIVTAFSRRLEHVGFYDRQKRGVGTFISRKQIEKMSVHNASDLLRSVPSLRLIPQPRRANNQVRGTRGNCRFAYIVDGARTLTDFEMDNIAAYAIEGIELYTGQAEVPAAFRGHAPSDGGSVGMCGVIAIWTRNSR